MLVLGIESSCDETAAALVRDDGTVVSDVVASQVKLHAPYGGVVPELASRAHVENVVPVVERALAATPRGLADVDGIAVTHRPGLVGALLVGVSVAKAMAFARGLPIVGVDHLEGHLLAVDLVRVPAPQPSPFGAAGETAPLRAGCVRTPRPFVGLLASGGHTALYVVRGERVPEIELVGQTRDDAAGEAFDKVAKLLGLGYPGGPIVDRLAAQGDPTRFRLPVPMLAAARLDRRDRRAAKSEGRRSDPGRGRRRFELSFSGLKTAVARLTESWTAPPDEATVRDLCASFQRSVVEVLVRKSLDACIDRNARHLVLCGGVAANRGLRARAVELAARASVEVHVPPIASCTDNAAMIAYAGALRLAAGERHELDMPVFSSSPLAGGR